MATIPEALELCHGAKCLQNATPVGSLGIAPGATIQVRYRVDRVKFQLDRGDPFELPLARNSTVKDAKLALVPRVKCGAESISLGFGAKTFGNNELLRHLHIPFGRAITVRVPDPVLSRSYFFMMEHEAFHIDLDMEATIDDAIERLTPRSSPRTKRIDLFYDGRPLKRGVKLSEINVDGCVVAETLLEPIRKLSKEAEPFLADDNDFEEKDDRTIEDISSEEEDRKKATEAQARAEQTEV
jgi:hypothetical protein